MGNQRMFEGRPLALTFKAWTPILFLLLPLDSALAQPAQRFEIGAQGAFLHLSSAPDTAFPGLGGRVGIHATNRLAFEAEINFFPTARHEVPRGGRKLQVLAGPTIRVGGRAVTVFVKARPGFIRFGEGQPKGVCIAIFPPPEGCYAARTMAAIDLGGGFEAPISGRYFFRFDVGDLMFRQPRSSFLLGEPQVRHNLQASAGVAWRL